MEWISNFSKNSNSQEYLRQMKKKKNKKQLNWRIMTLEHKGKAEYKNVLFLEVYNNKIFHFSFILKSKIKTIEQLCNISHDHECQFKEP